MALMQNSVFRRLNAFDWGVVFIVVLSVLGFGLARAGHAGVDKVVKGTTKLDIDVYITGLKTRDTDLFKVGEKSAITVRNQPIQPAMTISKVEHWQKQIAFLSPDGKKALAFADPANEIAHDFVVTVRDEQAECTDDGYVVRGNKVKIGNQMEIEGFKYRVQGVVADLRPAK